MSTSFQPQHYSITSSDTITLTDIQSVPYTWAGTSTGVIAQDITSVPITLYSNGATGSTITISGSGVGIGSSSYTNTWLNQEEFVNTFPDFERVKKMCETYPGLKIAYEKFATTYRLVKDDYDNPNTKK